MLHGRNAYCEARSFAINGKVDGMTLMMNTNVRLGGPLSTPTRGSLGNGSPGNGSGAAAVAGVLELEPARAETRSPKTVMVCDTQPVTAEGIRTVLAGNTDLQFHEVADSLGSALEMARRYQPNVLVVDKAFGIQALLEWL